MGNAILLMLSRKSKRSALTKESIYLSYKFRKNRRLLKLVRPLARTKESRRPKCETERGLNFKAGLRNVYDFATIVHARHR